MKEEVSFHRFWKRLTPNYLEKEKFLVIVRKQKHLQNLYLKLKNTFIFYQAIEIVVNCIRNRFHQKDHIEALQKMEILLLTLKRLAGQFDPTPCAFFWKNMSSKEIVKPQFFQTFNIIISHTFPEIFINFQIFV